MNTSLTVLLAALIGLGTAAFTSRAAESEGVAVAIVYDTSGSMRDTVADSNNRRSAKYLIANRALKAVAEQIQNFAATSGKPVQAGLFTFSGDSARAAVPFGPFNAEAFQSFANSFSNPSGNTPLGNALTLAGDAALKSPLSRKHVLVITDGMNTAGPAPGSTFPLLQRRAKDQHTEVGVHFVAFDIKASVFENLKKQGATVVAAANEAQLNTQLEFILQRKILLEDEEPKK